MKLLVQHDTHEYEVDLKINPVWCDIGSHYVSEWQLVPLRVDAAVCEPCYEHYVN